MNINGKLKEQIDVYTGTRKNIRVSLGAASDLILDTVG